MERTLTFTLGEIDALREAVRCKIANIDEKETMAWKLDKTHIAKHLHEAVSAYRELLEKLD